MQFNKTNSSPYPDALKKEANGLGALQKKLTALNITIKTPEIYQVDERTLVLQHIDHHGGSKQQWQQFGQALAQLHLHQEDHCGWDENNYIGLNPQNNTISDDWGHFFVHQRLVFQVNLIKDAVIKKRFKQALSSLEAQLIKYLNGASEYTSLLHGDLWSGNVLFDKQDAWLIDPAIYCGDAEADLAMTELFGGFPAAFYQAYNRVKPLSKHYALKKVIYNLYHQLNHYNLFGGSYLAGCEHSFEVMAKHIN